MGLEIMFVDHPMRKQAVLDKNLSILHSGHTGIVSKGLTSPTKEYRFNTVEILRLSISVKNWKFHLSLFLDKMSLEIMSDDHPSRKLALLNNKNIYFTK